ncbi:MAG: hypothetical protein MZV64_10345 [Ignavibacteriales bacterium]|nr:hypothetical protein [Ignavibacteriales bacterium]
MVASTISAAQSAIRPVSRSRQPSRSTPHIGEPGSRISMIPAMGQMPSSSATVE